MLNKFIQKSKQLPEFKRFFILIAILFMYDVFFIRSKLSFINNLLSGRYFVNYILSLIVLSSLILIIRCLFNRNTFTKLLGSLFILAPLAIQTAHYSFYKMPISTYGIRFFVSEPLLTIQLAFENLNYFKIFGFILFSLLILLLLFTSNNQIKYKKFQLAINFPIFVSLTILCGMNWYLILDYQHPISAAYASIPEAGRSFYFKQLKKNKPEISLAPNSKEVPNILWIIGESVAKSHMSLYGYHRKTTPNLDKLKEAGILIPFQNSVSIGPHTLISVPYMLVGKQNIDPHGTIYSAPNIFDYAKARGYDTAFISSQDLRWKNFDQLSGKNIVDFYKAGTDFSANVSVSKGADDLKVLHTSILPHLKQMRAPFLMIAHMDGSHYPYHIHSEKKYKKFFPETSPNGTNAYDNTIVYSDIYLNEIITAARIKDPNIWIFYTTDHGQNVPLAKKDSMFKREHEKNSSHSENKSERHIFSTWKEKITAMFEKTDENDDEGKIIFNQGYDPEIIHNAFFVLPPEPFRIKIQNKETAPIAQSDIFATILDLMLIENPVSPYRWLISFKSYS
ncbi:sulfatase-like hydrolase/transferase [Silvanigrella sp.]|jgi:glucan phosphoethanolaminetransferase (alkaline phosphatase superfamily)|uniref:sulfatase-like hydrolase/transferase n=1 Tax=Silvanigrella sp. TaxID=2024976 RepID=UPI0037C8C65C